MYALRISVMPAGDKQIDTKVVHGKRIPLGWRNVTQVPVAYLHYACSARLQQAAESLQPQANAMSAIPCI
jgi:hypothetical protein